jgi:NAD(P)H dehydrogenase (quinone)
MSDANARPDIALDEDLLRVLIVFYSRSGTTRQLAQEIAAGVGQLPATEASLLEVEDRSLLALRPGETDDALRRRLAATLNQLTTADALVVGAPAYFGSMASPLKRFFEDCATGASAILDRTRPWHHYLFHNKVGAAFTSSATPHGGNEQALQSMLTMLMHLGLVVVTPGQRGPILEQPTAPYGATAIIGPGDSPTLTDATRQEARYLGQHVTEMAIWLREGRSAAATHLPDAASATIYAPQDMPSASE